MPKLRTQDQIDQEILGRRHRPVKWRQIRVAPDPLTPVGWNNWWQGVDKKVRERANG